MAKNGPAEPYEFTHHTFMGLPPEQSGYESSRFVVISMPYDGTTSYMAGTRFGPRAIIAASQQVETYDHETGIDACRALGIHTFPEFATSADGPDRMLEQAERLIDGCLEDGKFPVILGGEHTVTLAPVRSCYKRFNDISVLQFDAHLDLRPEYQDSFTSHACVMRRIMELGPRVLNVGARAWAEHEHEIADQGIERFFTMPRIRRTAHWHERVIENLTDNVYITIDLDGLDPGIMPAVGTPEPGGLTWWDTIDLLDRVIADRNVVGCDVVELRPIGGLTFPEFTAARLAYRMISHLGKKFVT